MTTSSAQKTRHVSSLFDLTHTDVRHVLDTAKRIKAEVKSQNRNPILAGHVAALLFEKPSLRTRVSFEVGMQQMGGGSLFLGEDVGWGKGRENISDFAQVLSSYVDAIVCRAKSHTVVEELIKYSSCPVINGLTDEFHPCQALADMLTIEERGVSGKIAYVGDANNVAKSLAIVCAHLNISMSIASPVGYEFAPKFLEQLKQLNSNCDIQQTNDPVKTATDAVAVYTRCLGEHGARGRARDSCQSVCRLSSERGTDVVCT